MQRLFVLLVFLIFSLPLVAQNSKTTNQSAAGVEDRYDNANEMWRLNIMEFILQDKLDKAKETMTAMDKFTKTARSYVVFKRKGHEQALQLYYRNLENINRLEQYQSMLKVYKKEYPAYTKDFFSKYKLTKDDFKDFTAFEKIYERIMDRWRVEFEAALKAGKEADIRKLREDMKFIRMTVSVFVLFPGKSADKVPQLQKMENVLRHGIVMLKMHEETLSGKK